MEIERNATRQRGGGGSKTGEQTKTVRAQAFHFEGKVPKSATRDSGGAYWKWNHGFQSNAMSDVTDGGEQRCLLLRSAAFWWSPLPPSPPPVRPCLSQPLVIRETTQREKRNVLSQPAASSTHLDLLRLGLGFLHVLAQAALHALNRRREGGRLLANEGEEGRAGERGRRE